MPRAARGTASGAAQLLATAAGDLAARGVASARLDAEVLLAHCLGVSRNALIVDVAAGHERVLPPEATRRFLELIRRREKHEPVAYLTGHREFWSLDLEVTPDVLIPRPETEHVVERVLAMLPPPGAGAVRIVDVGTGSGAIAVAVAHERSDAIVLGVDRSHAALTVARRNAARCGVSERVHFALGDLLAPARGPFDAVAGNPPYIRRDEGDGLMPDVRDWEPGVALFDDEPGPGILARLAAGAARVLRPGGCLVLETAEARAQEALALLDAGGAWDDAGIARDHAGRERVIVARRNGS